MKRKQKSRPHLLLAILVCVLLVAVLWWAWSERVIAEQIIPITLTVEQNVVGFNVDTEGLFFGTIPPRGKITRTIVITNNEKIPLRATFFVEGNVSRFVSAKTTSPIVEPHNTTSVNVTATVSPDAAQGNYTGSFIIQFKKP